MTDRLRRSLLFLPGDSARKIEKAAQLDVDCVVMDLEDGVALSRKADARHTVRQALADVDFGRSERLVRVNAADSSLFVEDLHDAFGVGTPPNSARPDGVVLPKVDDANAVQRLNRALDEMERAHGWPIDSVHIFAVIETARGVLNLREIAQASPRLVALLFGAEDFASSVGAIRSAGGREVLYARSAVVTAAAAYRLQAIDMVFFDLHDRESFARECVEGRGLGYDGKMAIHPRQVEPIHEAFTPSTAEIERARRIVAAHEAQQAQGVGAFELDGRMVDGPVVAAAQRVLSLARQAGKSDAQ